MDKVDRPLGPLVVDIAGTQLTEEEARILQHPLVGMVILFTRNYSSPEQLMNLTHDIHALRNPSLLIAVDHEGGRVQRFREGFTEIPAMRNLGRLYDTDSARAVSLAASCGFVMASELRACGVDLSFAPCLDLDYGQSKVIGNRSFHRNPKVVATLSMALISGMAQIGLANCGKHFPGHGYVSEDSHLELPEDPRDLASLRSNDEVPYQILGPLLTSVMPAHVVYSQVDSTPAGFSAKWIQEELRGRLRFDGLVFSDDLSMKGAEVVGEVTARVNAALDAGCDMVLLCNDPSGVKRVLETQRWVRTKVFDERVSRLVPRGKFPSFDALRLNSCYQHNVERIKEFLLEQDENQNVSL
jgi:beta-N-acetylhexosaminidase